MWSQHSLFIVTFVLGVVNSTTNAASVALDISTNYQITFDNKYNNNHTHRKNELTNGNKEIRCYCNEPECVPQGYMCRGISGCFTKLPTHKFIISNGASLLFKPEQSMFNGCLVEEQQCPPEFLCCNEDLCNHVDSPAVKKKLKKTLRILLVGEEYHQQMWNQSQNSIQEEVFHRKSSIHMIKSFENYRFKTTTIVICICGIIVMLILMSLAIRLLQPVLPLQTMDKRLGVHFPTDSTPPLLLESPKIPIP